MLVVGLALVLQACGASSGSDQIRRTVSAYYAALAKRDAPAACKALSPAFWQATFQQTNVELAARGSGPLPNRGCEQTLAYLFHLGAGGSQAQLSGVTVTDVAIHGDVATATVAKNGLPEPARFIRNADGRWRIDCCAGSQLEHQPRVPYRVPSQAMLPTVKVGQIVISDNAAMRVRAPRVNEIIVFHPPRGADAPSPICADRNEGAGHHQACGVPTPRVSAQTFIKRVVGLPGDRIAIVDGHVIRNGVREQDSYIAPCGTGVGCNFPKPVLIPPGDYFLLGDNRGASDDSRFWGPIPRKSIIGLITP